MFTPAERKNMLLLALLMLADSIISLFFYPFGTCPMVAWGQVLLLLTLYLIPLIRPRNLVADTGFRLALALALAYEMTRLATLGFDFWSVVKFF